MKKETKFRVWNGEEMVDLKNVGIQYFDFEGSYALSFVVDGYFEFYAHERYNTSSEKASKFPLMQYIQILDKNKKEICEGDILKYEFESTGIENITGINKVVRLYKVFSVNGGFAINQFQDDFYKPSEEISFYESCADMQNYSFISNLEIIGNIYENPELFPELLNKI